MTTEELHGQVARAATVERELRDRIRDLEEKIARMTDKVQRAEADRDHAQMRWREAKEEAASLRTALAAAQGALRDAVKLAGAPWDQRASAAAVQRGIVNQLRMLRDRALNTSGKPGGDRG